MHKHIRTHITNWIDGSLLTLAGTLQTEVRFLYRIICYFRHVPSKAHSIQVACTQSFNHTFNCILNSIELSSGSNISWRFCFAIWGVGARGNIMKCSVINYIRSFRSLRSNGKHLVTFDPCIHVWIELNWIVLSFVGNVLVFIRDIVSQNHILFVIRPLQYSKCFRLALFCCWLRRRRRHLLGHVTYALFFHSCRNKTF